MKKNLFVLLSAIIFIYIYYPTAFPQGELGTINSTVPDSDGGYLIPLRISQEEGLYSSFSIVYPPGRFLIEALLFKLFTPTFTINHIFQTLTAVVFFPASLFILSYFLFLSIFNEQHSNTLKKIYPVFAYLTAVGVTILNMMFFRYAQEVHVIVAIFFSALLASKKFTKVNLFVLGILVGLTFLFRIDAGIILSISLFCSIFPQVIVDIKGKKTSRNLFLLGFLTIWFPILFLILLHGSLINFLYDTLILGLTVQPKFMSLPIPENELKLVYLASLMFLISSSIALFNEAKNLPHHSHQMGLKAFSIFAVLSYVSALGRSDEPHLWYGLVWVTPLVFYTGYRIILAVIKKEPFYIHTFISMSILCYVFSQLMIYFKSPKLFLVVTPLLFVIILIKRISIFSTLIAGLCVTLITFHSISYLKLKLTIPQLPSRTTLSKDLITSDTSEVGGLRIADETKFVLDQIRRDIPSDQKHLFIFPNNLLWNEYFHLENPTRYVLLALERSDWTEREVIHQLNRTQTQYFLIYEDSARLRKGPVWEWLLANTTPVYNYKFPEENAILTVRNKTQDKPIEYWLQY